MLSMAPPVNLLREQPSGKPANPALRLCLGAEDARRTFGTYLGPVNARGLPAGVFGDDEKRSSPKAGVRKASHARLIVSCSGGRPLGEITMLGKSIRLDFCRTFWCLDFV